MGDIQFPVNIKDIEKFENLNTDISINVLGYENEELYPLRVTKNTCRLKHINLLLLTNDKGVQHYCLITDLSRCIAHLTNMKANRITVTIAYTVFK